jgi:glycosyltransferase involved in cell wall biosynthesis
VSDRPLEGKHVCVIYDCFFPLTLGGAERWYRALAEALVEAGAQVTYLTRRQWAGEAPALPGITLVAASGPDDLYDELGVRRVAPALAFGRGVLRHLRRHRHDYDAVHLASFPFFSLLGARLALVGTDVPLSVDYHEVWSARAWGAYVGGVAGSLGYLVQRLCVALTPRAYVFTDITAERLRAQGLRRVTVLPGLLPDGDATTTDAEVAGPPRALFVARAIKDKGLGDLVAMLLEARRELPDLQLDVVSQGPERAALAAEVARAGLGAVVTLHPRLSDEDLQQRFAAASCLVMPSRREGYGMVIAEAAAHGTPSVVAAHPENLAVHLIEDDVNGLRVGTSPKALADGLVRVVREGAALRARTLAWSRAAAASRTIGASTAVIVRDLATH